MPEQFKPREVYRVAREMLGPHLKERGYGRTNKMGPGPSWEREAGPGYLLFGVHAGNYSNVLGGKFQADFEFGPAPLIDCDLLGLLTEEQLQAWRNIAWPIYGRALGLLPGGTDDALLQQERRKMYEAIGVTAWESTQPEWFGCFPWFEPNDLQPQFDFIRIVLPDVEARLLASVARSSAGE